MTNYDNLENSINEKFNEHADQFPDNVDLNDKRVKVLKKLFADLNGKTVLDVGCGKGRFSKVMIDLGANVNGIEPSEKLLHEARKIQGGSFLLGSSTRIPFPNETFDCILCIEVLQHIPDLKRAIHEMMRVLKPEGKIIIIDRNKLCFIRSLWKKYKEWKNEWLYPNNFPFREKSFTPGEMKKILFPYCKKIKVRYLGEYIQKGNPFYLFCIYLSEIISRICPPLSYNIAWMGVKK